jgi:hypothetical protein
VIGGFVFVLHICVLLVERGGNLKCWEAMDYSASIPISTTSQYLGQCFHDNMICNCKAFGWYEVSEAIRIFLIPAESFGMIVVIHESKQRIVYCTVHK